jgi:hypothetical protein
MLSLNFIDGLGWVKSYNLISWMICACINFHFKSVSEYINADTLITEASEWLPTGGVSVACYREIECEQIKITRLLIRRRLTMKYCVQMTIGARVHILCARLSYGSQ